MKWSAFGKNKRGKNGRTGPPVHDHLVGRILTAPTPNTLWLADITEHRTGEPKLYLSVKDQPKQLQASTEDPNGNKTPK